jgi:hypothetical protein
MISVQIVTIPEVPAIPTRTEVTNSETGEVLTLPNALIDGLEDGFYDLELLPH